MGGQRKNIGVVTEERKQQMVENYELKKKQYNKNKILRELQSNKRLFVMEKTISQYEWTESELAIITEYNTLYKTERTVSRPIINLPEPVVWPRPRAEQIPETQLPDPLVITNKTYTRDMAVSFLKNRINRKTNKPFEKGTVNGHVNKINPLLKLFGIKSSD